MYFSINFNTVKAGWSIVYYSGVTGCNIKKILYMYFVLFCCFTSQVKSYAHGGDVSSPNHTFFLGKLEKTVNQYFMHILSFVTDNNPLE